MTAVIAFGGGSGLDTRQGHRLHGRADTPDVGFRGYRRLVDTRGCLEASRPIVAVPTTAGTGSEVGRASVITNSQTHVKKIIFHPKLLPGVVICDPELTVGMPKVITAGTGMDAFAHCLEAYSSPFYHPMSAGVALEGLRLVKEFLPRAYKDGTDIEARTNMMAAAAMGAVAFQKGLGAIHSLSHPIGAVYNTHHGMTNAVVMPAVLRFNRPAIEAKIARAAAYCGLSPNFDAFLSAINGLRAKLNVPNTLKDFKVSGEKRELIGEMAIVDPTAGGNPVELTKKLALEIFDRAMEGRL
jgi:alcohol dehydrogenase class IV